MIEFLKNWILNIVVIIFFVAFIEIMLPKSNMKRYINMILGLLIILVLINPIIKFMSSDIDIEREVFKNMSKEIFINNKENLDYIETQNRNIIEIYKNKLKNEIKDLIELDGRYKIVKTNILIEENSKLDNYGEIKEIEIYLDINTNDNKSSMNIKVDDIDKIVINNGKANSTKYTETSIPEFETIINSISSNYKVPKEKIFIIFNTSS